MRYQVSESTASNMINIGIIEPNHLFSETYKDFFEALSDHAIVFRATALNDLLVEDNTHLPPVDVIILDVHPSGTAGNDTIKLLKKAAPSTRIILFTSRSELVFLVESLKFGADGIILKNEGLFELHRAINETLHNGLVISPVITRQLVQHLIPGNHSTLPFNLTIKEKEIIQLVKEGLSYKEMAESLGVTPFTVNHHLKKIYKKVGVNSRAQLMALLQNR